MKGSALEVLTVAARLGLTSFGGPVAHLAYFRHEYVVRRGWLDDARYADLVALCQFLPGPASSQVGMAIGIIRAGLPGGVAAWLGFTLPSAVLLVAFAYGLRSVGAADAGWLHGLKVVAVAVVAQAVWGMGRAFAADRARASLGLVAALVVLSSRTALTQVLVIVAAGLAGRFLLHAPGVPSAPAPRVRVRRGVAVTALVLFVLLLVGLPLARQASSGQGLAVLDSFYRTGSLVFGGGHVVLPLLHAEVVPPGWVTDEQFIAGYGAAQAVPGPLFTFAAYLGAVMRDPPNGWRGAGWALFSVFLPSFLLVVGALPFWDLVRARAGVQSALRGINAAVVGLLVAALYDPVWTSAIRGRIDFGLAALAFVLLVFWKVSPWAVVLLAAAAGALVSAVMM